MPKKQNFQIAVISNKIFYKIKRYLQRYATYWKKYELQSTIHNIFCYI